jgi:DNA-binding MarR family transcriptional regulator
MADAMDWDIRLGFLIHDVSRLRRVLFDRVLRPLGASRSQWWVLAFLSRDDGMTQTRLAEELDMGKVGLGGLIDRLEAAGLVERRTEPGDRRAKRVYMTREGRRFVARNRELDQDMNKTILQNISRDDIEATIRVLGAMKGNLLAALAPAEAEAAD